jgi:PBSX family phage terminase large subunit
MVTSPKQDKSFVEATHRFNIWVGAVRAGKTYSSIHAFINFLKNGPPGDAMIIGVNRGTIHRNVLTTLYKILGFPCPSPMCNKTTLYGRDLYFVGAPDISAVTTIQGSTLACAYVDEATCIPEPFWKMLETRLSVPGARLYATANPEGPSHWLKKEYIDRPEAHDIITFQFQLDDNPVLDEAYKKAIKASFSGVFYQRYILGEWALATGAIFDSWDEKLNTFSRELPAPNFYVAGLDYGTINPTACHIAAVAPHIFPQIRIEKEYYFDSKVYGRSKTDQELAKDIKEFLGYTPINALYVDPAAASLKLELRALDLPVVDANNDVLFGIKAMAKYIAGRNLVIHKSCKHLIEQVQGYAWDPAYADKGEDKPIKKNDHGVDSCRYLIASCFKHGLTSPDQNITVEEVKRRIYGDDNNFYGFNNDSNMFF